MSVEKPLEEGMSITEEELIARGYQLTGTLGFGGRTFKKDNQSICWNPKTGKIWRILPDS